MLRAVADTHTVIWCLFADQRLSATARTIDLQKKISRKRLGKLETVETGVMKLGSGLGVMKLGS